MMDQQPVKKDLWPKFDAYMKKVIRSLNNQYGRIIQKRSIEIPYDREQLLSILDHEKFGYTDEYTVEHHNLSLNGRLFPLSDDALFSALRRLSAKQLQVIIPKYWMGYSEIEIADMLQITPRSCSLRRQRALLRLQKLLKEEKHGKQKAPE